MPVFVKDLNLLFLCVPKTAGTAVAQLLIDSYGGHWLPEDHLWNDRGDCLVIDRKHGTLAKLLEHNIVSLQQLASWRIAAVTRNPFDWVVSLYEYRRQLFVKHRQAIYRTRRAIVENPSYKLADAAHHNGAPDWVISKAGRIQQAYEKSFSEYVHTLYGHAQNMSVCASYIDDMPVEVLRYESIEYDVASLLRASGASSIHPLPRVNVTQRKHKNWQSYYDPSSRKIIERAFLQDFGRFNYSFHEGSSRG